MPSAHHHLPIFFVSDGTGITAETLGSTLLTQFDDGRFNESTLPFINTPDKAHEAVNKIENAGRAAGIRPIVFSTTVNDDARAVLRDNSSALFLDLFDAFVGTLENALDRPSTHREGRAHGIADTAAYASRIEAMNYALAHDDGLKTNGYDRADVIIVAPSRCGKTPVSLYLAMQFGVFAANYPLTDEDEIGRAGMPQVLRDQTEKLYGLWIEPQQLQRIRDQRRPDSRYASKAQVSAELERATGLFERYRVPWANSSHKSIEEIATLIMQSKNLRHPGF
ncbi:kinase/pyrophosphorylase [Salinisphaera sp. USBA-960]|uniref:pyruvate, water dikinase regulatory protein n=1 Tax=Salinisphaera orenii TaxID=856731 RepID=UPI000DBE543B|nr:kinase/pyrophosphorylase [Salifodinibacter halophilus]NNC25812.1 kinase/pyrophosphorylase [Salifodinibacter halophilus]